MYHETKELKNRHEQLHYQTIYHYTDKAIQTQANALQ